MLNDILSAIPWGILLAFTIGPVFFVLLETSITKGFRAALIFDVGVVLGDIVFILIAYFSDFPISQFKGFYFLEVVLAYTQIKTHKSAWVLVNF